LFVCEEGVFLVDKKFSFFCLQCSGFDVLSTKKGETTLLEGELVRDKKTTRVIFYISDAVQINGEYCAFLTFKERLDLILNLLNLNKTRGDPFELNKKRFYTKAQFSDMIKAHIEKNQNGQYYKDEKRYHRVLSLIFKPNEPFPLLSSKKVFERKFLNSICFGAKKHHSPQNNNSQQGHLWSLFVSTEYGESEFRQIHFPASDEARLIKEVTQFQPSGNPIIECVYESFRAEWRYSRLMTTKHKPSKARVAMEMMIVMAENICMDEIIYRIQKGTNEDDWMSKHGKSE